jgi:hypothetical protein
MALHPIAMVRADDEEVVAAAEDATGTTKTAANRPPCKATTQAPNLKFVPKNGAKIVTAPADVVVAVGEDAVGTTKAETASARIIATKVETASAKATVTTVVAVVTMAEVVVVTEATAVPVVVAIEEASKAEEVPPPARNLTAGAASPKTVTSAMRSPNDGNVPSSAAAAVVAASDRVATHSRHPCLRTSRSAPSMQVARVIFSRTAAVARRASAPRSASSSEARAH